MSPGVEIIARDKQKLVKALERLAYSFAKVQRLTTKPQDMDDEALETWESFTARFARVVDFFLTRYVRRIVLQDDPGFQGTVRDFADQAEKLGFIDSADRWMELRGFRNIIVHEYEDEELQQNLESLRSSCPTVLALRDVLGKA